MQRMQRFLLIYPTNRETYWVRFIAIWTDAIDKFMRAILLFTANYRRSCAMRSYCKLNCPPTTGMRKNGVEPRTGSSNSPLDV